MAIEIRCTVRAEPADQWTVEQTGLGRPTEGETDLVLAAARTAVGDDGAFHLTVHSEIPVGRGLGSSAAAAAAGYAAARWASGSSFEPSEAYHAASQSDGHPENAAAAVFGGLVAALPGRLPARLGINPRLAVVLAVPNFSLSTEQARRSLPRRVDLGVAVRSMARSLALIEGLRTGDRTLLAAAGGDELHELPRRSLNSQAEPLMRAALDGGAFHACWSGAGPSVLAFASPAAVGDVRRAMAEAMGESGQVLTPAVASRGLM
ncbi:MAG TPA: hypothetical protein VIL12_00465 [Acidimicrobiia bacterium]